MLRVCVCTLAVFTRHANRIISAPCWHAWPVWLHITFPCYLVNSTNLEKNCWTWNMFWYSIQFLSETFLIVRRVQRDTIIMNIGRYAKCLILLSDFNQTWISSSYFGEILKYKIARKIIRWESSCSMRTGGRANGRTWQAISRFSQFCDCERAYKRQCNNNNNNNKIHSPFLI
jgi:hypothetical protein